MPAVIASAAVVPLHAAPSLRAEQVSQLVLGETGTVLESSGEWRHVRVTHDGYEGWAHRGYLLEREVAGVRGWAEQAGGWSEGARVEVDGVPVVAPLRARLLLDGDRVGLPDGRAGEVRWGAVIEAEAARQRARERSPADWAFERFAGAPYEWGGVTPCGVDCSGLVQTTFAARGIALPRDAAQQAETGSPVPRSEARPGDLVFFTESDARISHVAILAADDTIVHSTVACGGLVRESWLPGARAAALADRLVAVRRIPEDPA